MKRSIKRRFVLWLALGILVIVLTPVVPVASQVPLGGGGTARGFTVRGPQEVQSYNYQLLKVTTALWADGRGDVVVEQQLTNVDNPNWTSLTWYFNWYPGNYSQIRAWDDLGPLSFSTSQSGSTIYLTVNFRRSVQIGASYHYFMAITIANMANGSGNNWRANWYWTPGQPVQAFIQGVTFPSNSTFQTISPSPTTQQQNYLEWRFSNTPTGWTHTIDVNYTLSSVTTVPLFLQKTIQAGQPKQPWEDNLYAYNTSPLDNIGRWGCALTSAAMIVDYWAQVNQKPLSVDPGSLNQILIQKSGYTKDNWIIWGSVALYAASNAVPLNVLGILGRNYSQLDNFLTSGDPMVLGVDPKVDSLGRTYANHWVVATGKTSVNGQATYSINDPLYGSTTLYNQWSNNYVFMVPFINTSADKRSLTLSAQSPIELLVTDPQGRKSGYDPSTGTSWNDIPNAMYFVNSIAANADINQGPFIQSKDLVIPVPLDGAYNIKVLGTGIGAYVLESIASNWNGQISRQIFSGSAQSGSVYSQSINYSSYTGVNPLFYLPIITK